MRAIDTIIDELRAENDMADGYVRTKLLDELMVTLGEVFTHPATMFEKYPLGKMEDDLTHILGLINNVMVQRPSLQLGDAWYFANELVKIEKSLFKMVQYVNEISGGK